MLRVLIAEDEALVAFTLRGQLEKRGCEVVGSVGSGEEVVRLCQETGPDVVLMDIRMPGMDGLQATRTIMQDCPTCVVMLTAAGQHVSVAKAEEAGAMAYLVKPVSGDQILPAIELAQRRFKEFTDLQKENADLQTALATRKLVEKAKGLIMEKGKLSEAEAFRKLQKAAMERRLPLKTVAERVLAAAKDFEKFFSQET